MNKICTTIKQSQKLIELGIDVNTADMIYNLFDESCIRDDTPIDKYHTPAWSLTALLDILNKTAYSIDEDASVNLSSYKAIKWDLGIDNTDLELITESDPIDACVEMICKIGTKDIDEKNIKELIENDGGKLKNIAKGDFVIPNSVTSIGDWAFRECYGLRNITIPDSVTTIGNFAFYECKHLTGITIPNSVTTIGNHAFYNCKDLVSVIIPNSVTSISNSMFEGCSHLTSVTIPNSVVSIGNYAFHDCKSLTNIIIPNSITEIGYGAFMWCENLTNIIIPIGSRAKFEQLLPQELHHKLKEQDINNLSENEL